MKIVPFRPAHLESLIPQEAQSMALPYMNREHGEQLVCSGPAFTGIAGGRIIGCAGLVAAWPNRAIAWTVMARSTPTLFLRAHRAIRRFLDDQAVRRIETYVVSDFDAGHRWVRALGFVREAGPLRQFDPLGNSYDIYVRFNHG